MVIITLTLMMSGDSLSGEGAGGSVGYGEGGGGVLVAQ